MKNPFSLSDDNLKVLLSSYSAWRQGQKEGKEYAGTQEQQAEDLKKTLLNKRYVSNSSDDELYESIFDHLRSVEGPAHIRLGKPRITAEMAKIKRNLIHLIESKEDPFEKAAEILAGEYKILHFAKAFWTPIFQAQYPNLLPNWNNKTKRFFKKLGINLTGNTKLKVERNYRLLSDAFLYLQDLDPAQDFHTLNYLMHYGTVVPEGVEVIDGLFKGGQEEKPEQGDDLARTIEKRRKRHGMKDRIQLRKEYEAKARNLLEKRCGRFDEKDLRQFFEFLNTDFWKGTVRRDRFSMAYTGKNLNALVDQLHQQLGVGPR